MVTAGVQNAAPVQHVYHSKKRTERVNIAFSVVFLQNFYKISSISVSKESEPFTFLLRQRARSSAIRGREKRMPEPQNAIPEVDRDTTPRVAPLPPQRVILPTCSPVIQIACGLHHTVVLTQSGEVFTFGSNQYGQLCTGDLLPYVGPVQVKLNSCIVQVAAGSNHTVLLSSRGVIYTCGNHLKGQLGRLPHDMQHNPNFLDELQKSESNEEAQSDVSHLAMIKQKFLWNCTPGQVS